MKILTSTTRLLDLGVEPFLVSSSLSAAQLQKVACEKAGLVLMREAGWDLCRRGLTTPQEVLSVTKV